MSESTEGGEGNGTVQPEKPSEVKDKAKSAKKHWIINFSAAREERDKEHIDPEESTRDTTDVKQVWFAGCHSGAHSLMLKV